jgi:hypothetical protein
LVAWAAWEWYRSRGFEFLPMLWTTAFTLVVTHFVSPRTATTHFAPLVIPVFGLFRLWKQDHPRFADLWAALTMAGVLVGMWWLFAVTVQGRQESALLYLPIPLILLILLPFLRRRWIASSGGAG